MIYICGEIITIHANVILMKVMMKKEYSVPMMECTKSTLRACLLAGSNGEVPVKTTITVGKNNDAAPRPGTDLIHVGGEEQLPDWN